MTEGALFAVRYLLNGPWWWEAAQVRTSISRMNVMRCFLFALRLNVEMVMV